MESKVTVLTPNGRRQNIKVSPNTTILKILEEACAKHGFDSESYCLKHHKREVDLTQMFRFSGLPNNCLLEMTECEKKRVAEEVDICIELEDGSRQLAKFKSNESLWNVIEKLAPDAGNTFENPVILYMRQEIRGQEALMKSTLKSLGIIKGRGLFRLVDKRPEELKTQANVYKPPTEREKTEEASDSVARDESKKSGSGGGRGGGFSITKELVQALKTTTDFVVAQAAEQPSINENGNPNKEDNVEENKPKYDWGTGKGHSMQNRANEEDDEEKENAEMGMETEPEYTIIGERNAILYSLNSGERRIEEVPDSFYDLTANDLKLILKGLQKISTGNEDAPLMTGKLRELEQQKTMLNKIAHYKNCIIRVQFPDRYVLQGVFKPSDTIYNVVSFVQTFLRDPKAAFSLFTIPPKTNLPLHKNLLELDLVPTALLHFTLDAEPTNPDDRVNYLKAEYLNRLTSIEGAIYAANKLRVTHRSRSPSRYDDDDDDINDEQPGPSTGAIPKRSRNED